jgi:uncharacterized membrane protein
MNFRVISSYLLAFIFVAGGFAHFGYAWDFQRLLPNWVPAPDMLVWISGIVEIVLGACLIFPRLRSMAALGILILLILYTPIHVIDALRTWPVIGSKALAWARIPLQFVMIWMAYLAANWDKN